MKYFKYSFILLFFLTSNVWGEPSIINGGIITDLSICSDVNSVRFKNEYNYTIQNYDPLNSDLHVMELTVINYNEKYKKKRFFKYCLIINEYKTTLIKSNLIDDEALRPAPPAEDGFPDFERSIDNLQMVKNDINMEIGKLKKIVTIKDYEPWISFYVLEQKLFENNNYFCIKFTGSYNSFGGILYIIDTKGNILTKMMLAEKLSKPELYFCKILSEDKVVLFREAGEDGFDTEIIVLPINSNNK